MSGLAVFGLKCPSFLDFERQKEETPTENNLRDLYHVNRAPSDTYLRQRLDDVSPKYLRSAFKKFFASFQRRKGLERQVELLDATASPDSKLRRLFVKFPISNHDRYTVKE